MKNPNDLFKLIHSLTSNEKRHFRMSSNFQNGKNAYLILFDILEKQGVYDEEKLLKKLLKLKIIDANQHEEQQLGKLRAMKSYTKTCILRSLRFIHSQRKIIEQKINNALENARILSQKGLIRQSEAELASAKKMAQEFELYQVLIEINRLEIEIIKIKSPKNTLQKLKVIHHEINRLIQLNHLENTYDLIISELEITYRNRGRQDALNPKTASNLELLLDEKLLNLEVAKTSMRTHYSYYYIWGYYHLPSNNIEQAYENFKEVIHIWSSNKNFIKAFSQAYMGVLSNYLNICIISNRINNSFLTYLDYLDKCKKHTNKEQAYHFQIVAFLKLSFYLNKGELDAAESTVQSIKKQIEKFKKLIPISRIVAFYNNIISYYFLMENYKEAGNLVFLMMNDVYRNEQREDLQARIKTFNLIFEFETCVHKEFFTRVESVSNSLKYYKLLNPFTNLIFKNLILVSLAYSKRDEQEKFRRFYAQLIEYKTQIGENNLKGLGIEEIEIWLQSKISNRTMKDIYLDSKKQAVSI